MKSKLGGFKKSDLTLPLKPFIRMEILSDDSLEIAGRIILILLTAVIVFFFCSSHEFIISFCKRTNRFAVYNGLGRSWIRGLIACHCRLLHE